MTTTPTVHDVEPQAQAGLADIPTNLDATHRCDRCGAQAYVAAMFGAGPLLFCRHHANGHEAAILAAIVVDQRHLIEGENKTKGEAHA